MREKMLTAWGRFSSRHPGKILLVLMLLSAASIYSSSKLSLSMRWSDLLPLDDPMVQEFEKIQKDYTSTSNSIIVITGPEQQMKNFAEEIAPQLESLTEYVKRIYYKAEVDFIKSHGLMLVKTSELEKMASNNLFEDLNLTAYLTHLNDNFEDVYFRDEESISDKEKEYKATQSLDGIEFWIEALQKFVVNQNTDDSLALKSADMLLLGDPYFISYDKRMMLIMIEPTFDIVDIDACMQSTISIQELIDNALTKYPGINAGLTGTIPLAHDEMVYSTRDMQTTSIVALILVILLFAFSFRMLSTPLLVGVNLIVSIIIASGIISLFIDSLNMMTSMFAVILIGLGIDFSIHIISLYYERRNAGDEISKAITYTLSHSGAGIITGGLTTSVAFFTLMISGTRGIKEMGLVLGLGILGVMIATILFLPSLLIIRELIADKFIKRRSKTIKRPAVIEFKFLGKTGDAIKKRPVFTFIAAALASIVMLYFALDVEFDYNYLNLEPVGLESIALQDSMLSAFEMSPDFLMVSTKTIDEAEVISKKARKISTVSMVESISNYVPPESKQLEKVPILQKIRKQLGKAERIISVDSENIGQLTEQLNRLDMNIYELGQMAFIGGQDKVESKCSQITGDPETDNSVSKIQLLISSIIKNNSKAIKGLNRFQSVFQPEFRKTALKMSNPGKITIEDLPENIRKQFLNKDEDKFLVTIFPTEQVWDYNFLRRFNDQMQRIDNKITGTPPLMLRLIDLIGEDGRRACVLTLMVVLLLLWIDFRNLRLALIAITPLIIGVVWMIGFLTIFRIPFTIANVMVIPMIIGIGIDDGVHLIHRYRVEGWHRTKVVLSSTGRAILLTSLTTIAGFGSLMLAKYRGFASMGSLLVIGVAACFITSVIFLPALVNIFINSKTENS